MKSINAHYRSTPRSTTATHAQSAPPQCRSHWLAAALAFVIVSCGCGHRQKEQSSTSAPSREDGLPRTLGELDAWYVEPSAGQNSAIFYVQAFQALKIPPADSPHLPLLGKGKLPALGSPTPPVVKSAITALARSNLEALQFFSQGAKCDQSRYPVDLSRGLDATFPHLVKIKSAVQFLELAAIAHAEANDGKAAADDLVAGLGLGRSLQAEPALLSQLVRAATLSVAVGALEQVLNRTALPQEGLVDLLKSLRQMDTQDAQGESFNRAIAAERITALAVLADRQALLLALKVAGNHVAPEQRNQIVARLEKGGKLEEDTEYLEQSFQQLIFPGKRRFPIR